MFRITQGKGFGVTFENGWTVSVQFGSGNYCEIRDHGISSGSEQERKNAEDGSANAEIAAWDKDDNWYDFGNDTVKGWVRPNEVLEFMNMIASK